MHGYVIRFERSTMYLVIVLPHSIFNSGHWEAALLLHRKEFDCGFSVRSLICRLTNGQVNTTHTHTYHTCRHTYPQKSMLNFGGYGLIHSTNPHKPSIINSIHNCEYYCFYYHDIWLYFLSLAIWGCLSCPATLYG